MKRAALIAVPLVFAACGGGSASGGHTPSPVAAAASPTPTESAPPSPDQASPPASRAISPRPTGSPITPLGVYGIFVRDFLVEGGTTYSINLVRNDGGLQTTATAAKRSHPKGILVQMPNISASGSAVYYLDGDASLRFLRPDGKQGAVKTLPVDASSAAVFAVSPDDKRIAVAIITYPFPAKTRIYVEDLYGTANHLELFSSSTALEYPVGWHQGQIVLGVGLNAYPQNAYEGFAYNYSGYHVASASTGARISTVCAAGATFGPPVPAGATCLSGTTLLAEDWAGGTHSVPTPNQCTSGVLSPNGSLVAEYCSTTEGVTLVTASGGITSTAYASTPIGWIDPLHVVLQAQSGQLSFLNVQLGSVTAIQAGGFFAGVVPGSL